MLKIAWHSYETFEKLCAQAEDPGKICNPTKKSDC